MLLIVTWFSFMVLILWGNMYVFLFSYMTCFTKTNLLLCSLCNISGTQQSLVFFVAKITHIPLPPAVTQITTPHFLRQALLAQQQQPHPHSPKLKLNHPHPLPLESLTPT